MAKRISTKNVGQVFNLRFNGSRGNGTHEMECTLLRIEGEGEDARAVFTEGESASEWEAYRFNKRWSYGSSADYLSVAS